MAVQQLLVKSSFFNVTRPNSLLLFNVCFLLMALITIAISYLAESFLEPGNARMAEISKMRCTGNRFIFAVLRVKVKVKLSGKAIQNYSGESSKPPPYNNIFVLPRIRSPDCLTLVFTIILGQVLSCSLHILYHNGKNSTKVTAAKKSLKK